MKIDKRLFGLITNLRFFIALALLLSALTGAVIVGQAYALSTVINAVFLQKQGLAQLFTLLLLLAGIITLRAGLNWAIESSALRVAGQVKTALRTKLFAHLQKLGPLYTRKERSGELLNTLSEGVEALDSYFSQFLPQIFLTALVPLAIFITVLITDWPSTIVLIVTAPLLPFFMALVGIMADKVLKHQWGMLSLMNAHFLDVLQGLQTLKLFGRSKLQEETIRDVSERFRQSTLEVLRAAFLSSFVMELGSTLSTAVIAVEIGLRLLSGSVSFQTALFILLLAPEFYLPLRTLGTRYHSAKDGTNATERIFEILETPVPENLTQSQTIPELKGSVIRFTDVHYSYDEERPALRGITFTAHPGQRIALVGATGSGKSTIANLLLRFIEPQQGEILIGDTPLNTLSADSWRAQVAWVPQQPYLFNTTIAENIRFGRPEATLAEIREAARQANIADFIETLPQGYETLIGERGARLSGGQQQRLSLARAFLKDAPILVLDEATANLDNESERQVLAASRKLMEGRTVFGIAHRLNTVYGADQIIVLNEGRVAEVGTHAELQRHSGIYRQLVKAFGGRE